MTLILSGTDGLSDVDGSAATPAIRGTDANTGIFFGTDIIGFSEGGVEAMRIDASGNVGIGGTVDNHGGYGRCLQISATAGAVLELEDSSSYSYLAQNGTTLQIRNNATAGVMTFATEGTERARIDSSGNWYMNSGYGSSAIAYGCRAWVNFNGTGTVAIRASGNVSSVSDYGTGNYGVNFSTAMPDANYSVQCNRNLTTDTNQIFRPETLTTSSVTCINSNPAVANYDSSQCFVAVFR